MKLIERLKNSVDYAEREGENMDEVSWGMQDGILISYNEGKNIVAAFEAMQEIIKISDRKHDAWDKGKQAIRIAMD